MSHQTVHFSVLCSMLEAVSRSKKPAMKRKHIRTFLDHVYTDHEFFSAIRLILPSLDRERATYGLKEAVLAKCLADGLGLSKESEDAKKLLNWRKGGAQAGANAGNFPLVAAEVLFRRQRTLSGGLKIKDVNDFLDRLALAESREEKTSILSELINKTNAQEMRWIIMFILKDLKLGISEKSIFHEFHPDAEDLFNVTCDLKLVCEKLKDRNQRYKRQDIEVGKPVRPQLASRVADVDSAWKKLRGKQIVVECKFDGDRIQVHKNGNDVHFFSRSFIDHVEYREAMSSVIQRQVKGDRCILDGEMLVWDRATNRFAEFGSNQEIAKAARDGLETNRQLCYVAFDILYAGDTSVIHQTLHERQALLKKVVQPLKGQLEILVPGNGMNSDGLPDEPSWSILAFSAEEVNKFFLETVEKREEGVVIKDLDSKWEPGDRSGKWFKLKPDYVHTDSDLDVLIIGGYYGSGRRGGQVAQFLLGLAERSRSGGYPTRFFSFCKVGTGLTEDELNGLVNKLKPYFRRNGSNMNPPSFYVLTNSAKERPDVWIDQPEKSVILEITSDIRTIKSEVFASPYSLRFPRVHRVRYDKPWYDCLDVQSLIEVVQSRSGVTADPKENGKLERSKRLRQSSKKSVKLLPLVPSHMLLTDVSHVKRETSIFKGLVFYIVNTQVQQSKDFLHTLIVENGGQFSMNMNSTVTHAVAAERKGVRYQAAALHRDVIHQSWVMDCSMQKHLLPLSPKYFLHLSDSSKSQMNGEVDEFGDYFFWDVDVADLKQIFQNMDTTKLKVHEEKLHHYTRKYCSREDWCQFCDCCIYFHSPIHSTNMDSQKAAEITLKRLELDVLTHEGEVTKSLRNATHMIVYTTDNAISFRNILKSVACNERRLLKSKNICVVSHDWLEDSLKDHKKLGEEKYNLMGGSVTDSDEEQTLSPENDLFREHSVNEAQRLSKTTGKNPCSTRGDSSSENDDVAPRRQLYTQDVPKGKIQEKHDITEKNKMVLKQSKGGKALRKRNKGHCDETKDANFAGYHDRLVSLDDHINSAAMSKENRHDSSSVIQAHQLDNPESSLQAMLVDMIPSFDGFQERHETITDKPEGGTHSLVNKETATDLNACDNLRREGSTEVVPAKKRKVSYKGLVENLFDAQ